MQGRSKLVFLLVAVSVAFWPGRVSTEDSGGDAVTSGYHAHSFPNHDHQDESEEAVKGYLFPKLAIPTDSPKGDVGDAGTDLPKVSQHPAAQGRSIFSTIATYLPLLLSSREENASSQSPINVTDLLRMVGIDSNRIGTMVINAVVYLIEMVSSHFFGASNSIESRKIDSPGSLLLYLFDSKRAENFMRMITNPNYPSSIIANLKKQTGNDTVCIQQLICKMSPFWWGVNRSLRDLLPVALGKTGSKMPNISLKSMIQKYVPSMKDFTSNSDDCDLQYPGCIVMATGQHHYNNSHQVPH